MDCSQQAESSRPPRQFALRLRRHFHRQARAQSRRKRMERVAMPIQSDKGRALATAFVMARVDTQHAMAVRLTTTA